MSKKLLLNQVIALVTGKKALFQKFVAQATNGTRQEQVDGLIRSYTPFNDEDRNIPTADSKGIAVDLRDVVKNFETQFAEIVDLIATNDVGNQSAVADVCATDAAGNDVVVLRKVPVTHLLYLEKVLSDMRAFIAGLPTLNPMQKWTFDANRDYFVTAPVASTRTAKRKQKFVKAEATDKHPAQVDVYDEDVPVGTWSTTYISTALEVTTKKAFLQRVDSLIDGVKKAREEANGLQVEIVNYGKNIVDYVFEDI